VAAPTLKTEIAFAANLVDNGEFETNTTDWSALGAATISRSTTQAHVGTASLRVITTGIGDGPLYDAPRPSFTADTTYHASLWVFSASGGESVLLQWDEVDENNVFLRTNSAASSVTLVAGWQQLSMTATTGANVAFLNLYWKKQNAGASTLYTDTAEIWTSAADSPVGFYYQRVVADQPWAYWRLNDLTSPLVDAVGGHNAPQA
jgi:hypothetical protein